MRNSLTIAAGALLVNVGAGHAEPAPTPDDPLAVTFPAAVPVEVDPARQPYGVSVEFAGWSSDGKEYGFCLQQISGIEGDDPPSWIDECQFRTGKKVETHENPGRQTKAGGRFEEKMRKRAEERGYGKAQANCPWAADVLLTWRFDDKRSAFLLGAKLRGGKKSALPIVIPVEYSEGDETPQLAGFDVNPACTRLAVLIAREDQSSGGGAAFAAFREADVRVVVGQAYNLAGLALHRQKKHVEAAALFRKAHAVDPSSVKAIYNLASAYARAGDSLAEEALRRAVQLGGKKLKKKARRDPDFASVRQEPWFVSLTK